MYSFTTSPQLAGLVRGEFRGGEIEQRALGEDGLGEVVEFHDGLLAAAVIAGFEGGLGLEHESGVLAHDLLEGEGAVHERLHRGLALGG